MAVSSTTGTCSFLPHTVWQVYPKGASNNATKAAAKEAAAKKRKASAELWLAVEPKPAPKKLRGPPKQRKV